MIHDYINETVLTNGRALDLFQILKIAHMQYLTKHKRDHEKITCKKQKLALC